MLSPTFEIIVRSFVIAANPLTSLADPVPPASIVIKSKDQKKPFAFYYIC